MTADEIRAAAQRLKQHAIDPGVCKECWRSFYSLAQHAGFVRSQPIEKCADHDERGYRVVLLDPSRVMTIKSDVAD